MICCALFQPFDLWHAIYLNPKLKDKPLVSLNKNKIKNASKLAKQANIKIGMPVEGAKANCDDLVIVDTTPTMLKQAWDELLNQLYAFTNQIEAKELGLVYLDLNEQAAQLIAETFNARVATASNKQDAHLLALTLNEGEDYSANQEEQKQVLESILISVLEQISIHPKTIERFHWLGLETLGDLQNWSKHQLSLYLGEEAKLLVPYLKGPYDKEISIFKPNLNLKASYSFEDAVFEPWQINPVLEHLLSQLLNDLADKAASRLSITAELDGLSFSATRLSKAPLNSFDQLYRLASLSLKDTGVEGFGMDKLSLELSGIYRLSKQESLFKQKESRAAAIKKVEERFPASLFSFKEQNPFLPIPEFQYKQVPLASGSEVKHEALSFNRTGRKRQTSTNQQPASLIHS